jgi:hypothetical protein
LSVRAAQSVQFMAISGDSQPSYARTSPSLCSTLGEQVKALFAQVLLICDKHKA